MYLLVSALYISNKQIKYLRGTQATCENIYIILSTFITSQLTDSSVNENNNCCYVFFYLQALVL